MKVADLLGYPAQQHVRLESPPEFSDYRRYKPYLRREFARACVYCRVHDGLRGHEVFAVEHYLPKRFFPLRETDYTNLYYSCDRCNNRKKTWPFARKGTVWTKVSDVIPNPCDHRMADHLEVDASSLDIRGKSDVGNFAYDLLGLDRAGIELRKIRVLFQQHHERRMELRKREKVAKKRLRNSKTQAERDAILAALDVVKNSLALIESDLLATFGAPP